MVWDGTYLAVTAIAVEVIYDAQVLGVGEERPPGTACPCGGTPGRTRTKRADSFRATASHTAAGFKRLGIRLEGKIGPDDPQHEVRIFAPEEGGESIMPRAAAIILVRQRYSFVQEPGRFVRSPN